MLIEDSDEKEFGFILDTYWLQYGGVNPAEYIRRVAGRMKVCHFKDDAVIDNTPTFAEIGCGNLNLREAYHACRESGVQYIAIEQDTCPRDPFDCLRVSLENLNKILSIK